MFPFFSHILSQRLESLKAIRFSKTRGFLTPPQKNQETCYKKTTCVVGGFKPSEKNSRHGNLPTRGERKRMFETTTQMFFYNQIQETEVE